MSVSFIIEEGLPVSTLKKVIHSIKVAAHGIGLKIVTGDTKVVEKGSVDQLFINTTGIGSIDDGLDISSNHAMAGDRIILSGTIGNHGIAVLSQRDGFQFEGNLQSDCAPLNHLVSQMVKKSTNIHVMRDPTRGGVAAALNEIALQSGVEILIKEKTIPIRDEVMAACEMLGLDPLYVPSEGRLILIAFVAEQNADSVLQAMKEDPLGREAAIIGEVFGQNRPIVLLETLVGAKRILPMPRGELLPRIC